MAILQRHKSTIFGLTDDLTLINQTIATETTDRTNADTALATSISDLATQTTADITAVSEASLQKAANLSDVVDPIAARTNLQVLSDAEVTALVEQAKLAIGSNYTVANLVERDALTNLDVADRVMVIDDGDTRWALYGVGTVDAVTGAVTAWFKLADQDALENALSATSIKAAYESNADTNAFTDAEKATLAFITATNAIDLDDAVLGANLVTDLTGVIPAGAAPTAEAVKAYADLAATAGGSVAFLGGVVVTGSTITLPHVPKNGLASIMNFGTVRYVDAQGVAFDAPLVATADPLVFTVSTDVADEWDTFTVQVQFLYTAA